MHVENKVMNKDGLYIDWAQVAKVEDITETLFEQFHVNKGHSG